LFADNTSFVFLNTFEAKLYKGSSTPENFRRAFNLMFSVKELLAVIKNTLPYPINEYSYIEQNSDGRIFSRVSQSGDFADFVVLSSSGLSRFQRKEKGNNPYGHGHNYVLEVTVAGVPNPETGYVIDLKKLKKIIKEEIFDYVDHKHLNYDVPFLRGIIPSAENIAVVFWRILEDKIKEGKLHRIKLFESDNNFVEYYGESVDIQIYHLD